MRMKMFWTPVIAGLAGLLLCSCVYDAPFEEKATIAVDPALTGTWGKLPAKGENIDEEDRLVIVPFNATEYVVVESPAKEALYFRAYSIQIEHEQYVQMEWLGMKENQYHLSRYSIEGDVLTVSLLNRDVVSADLKDSAALRAALLAHRADPDLFTDTSTYRKIQ